MRNAPAAAKGAVIMAIAEKKPRTANCIPTLWPAIAVCTVFAPKIRTGIYRGMIIKDNSKPPLRSETVKAAPTAPIRLIVSVPSAKDVISATNPAGGKLSISPNSGDKMTIGTPVVSQCTKTLEITT